MLLDEKVIVVASGKCKSYYENKGYKLPYSKDLRGRIGIKKGAKIEIDIVDLPKYSQVGIKYKCDDCGCINTVPAQSIFGRENSQYNKTGETLCSDCANHRMSGVNNSRYIHGNNRYCEYRYNAKKRNIDFSLTVEQFESITDMECHYCGGFSSDRFENSRGNGVDRMDSDIGYIFENCVPCCSTCNFVKNTMKYKDFILYIKQLYNKVKNYEI